MHKYFKYGVGLVAGVILAACSHAEESQGELTLLFVQTAKSVAFEGDSLTLQGPGKTTLFFSDRPQRVAGHMETGAFLDSWDEGDDSFASNPPNATLSILDDDAVRNVVVELRTPRWHGDDLTYTVTVIDGEMPTEGGVSSLFIDIIGRPFTPLSYAGMARRRTRRAVVYGGAAMAAASAAKPSTVIVEQPSEEQPSEEQPSEKSTEQKLEELEDMYKKGLIDQDDYDQKKQSLLNAM